MTDKIAADFENVSNSYGSLPPVIQLLIIQRLVLRVHFEASLARLSVSTRYMSIQGAADADFVVDPLTQVNRD